MMALMLWWHLCYDVTYATNELGYAAMDLAYNDNCGVRTTL